MASSLIAKRYAKALIGLAIELNVVEETKADMELVLSICQSNKDFVQMLKSPVIRIDKKQKVLKVIFADQISEMSMRYLDIIVRKRRESILAQIAEEYINAYKKIKNIFTVDFESAVPISEDTRKKVIALLEDQTKATIELIEEVKKELIGGFVMNYNDYKYDASISFMLKRLKKSAAEVNLYKRKI